MAVDLAISPWNRLAKLAPPDTTTPDLQAAADRYGLRADLYAAAADLWEDAAGAIDLTPDDPPDPSTATVSKVSQDGISVEYAHDALAGNGYSVRVARHAQYLAMARRWRKRAKPNTPVIHDVEYNPWLNTPPPHEDCDTFIDVTEDV